MSQTASDNPIKRVQKLSAIWTRPLQLKCFQNNLPMLYNKFEVKQTLFEFKNDGNTLFNTS